MYSIFFPWFSLPGINSDGTRSATTVSRPLGDRNTIALRCQLSLTYDELLNKMQDSFFPGGQNVILGSLEDYTCEIVNCHNDNITKIDDVFTISRYMDLKHIAGEVRFYLLTQCNDNLGMNDNIVPVVNGTVVQVLPVDETVAQVLPVDEMVAQVLPVDEMATVAQMLPGADEMVEIVQVLPAAETVEVMPETTMLAADPYNVHLRNAVQETLTEM
jgi:hypothetical protein